jgi:hypothetical protein
MSRERVCRSFLLLAVLVGGPLLGAKLFDLVVLAGAQGANPPASLAMMPYGKAWPVDTGVFFIPLSTLMLVAGFSALVTGWRTPWRYSRKRPIVGYSRALSHFPKRHSAFLARSSTQYVRSFARATSQMPALNRAEFASNHSVSPYLRDRTLRQLPFHVMTTFRSTELRTSIFENLITPLRFCAPTPPAERNARADHSAAQMVRRDGEHKAYPCRTSTFA